jgi:predicted RNA-binding Zn-ribbon protein involved in translation (DUF1610 family)
MAKTSTTTTRRVPARARAPEASAGLPVQCPNCGSTEIGRRENLSVRSVQRGPALGWTVLGNVAIRFCEHNKCANCGMVFDTINRELPAVFPSLKCPLCRSSKHLRCSVSDLAIDGDSWKFEATVRCTLCSVAATLYELIPRLSNLKKLKIGWTGIELMRNTRPPKKLLRRPPLRSRG